METHPTARIARFLTRNYHGAEATRNRANARHAGATFPTAYHDALAAAQRAALAPTPVSLVIYTPACARETRHATA